MKWLLSAIALCISTYRTAAATLSRVGTSLSGWAKKTYVGGPFYDVAKTACGEVAVLLFVFPLIDMLGRTNDPQRRNWPFVIWCIIMAFVFVGIAGMFARMQEEAEAKKEEGGHT